MPRNLLPRRQGDRVLHVLQLKDPFSFVPRYSEAHREAGRSLILVIPAQAGIQARRSVRGRTFGRRTSLGPSRISANPFQGAEIFDLPNQYRVLYPAE